MPYLCETCGAKLKNADECLEHEKKVHPKAAYEGLKLVVPVRTGSDAMPFIMADENVLSWKDPELRVPPPMTKPFPWERSLDWAFCAAKDNLIAEQVARIRNARDWFLKHAEFLENHDVPDMDDKRRRKKDDNS